MDEGRQHSSELAHGRARQQEVERRVPAGSQADQQDGHQGGHLPPQGHARVCRSGRRRAQARRRRRRGRVLSKSAERERHRAELMGHDIDKLERVIRQPADGEHHGGGDEQRRGLLVAPVGGQRGPAAPQVGDDEAAVDGDAEQRGHVVDQEGRDQEEEPLAPAHRPGAAHVKVDVGDFGEGHGDRHQPDDDDDAQPVEEEEFRLGCWVDSPPFSLTKQCSHLGQISRGSHLRCNDAIPQHRQSSQAEDFHPHRHRGHEPQQDARGAAELPVLEARAEEDAGEGEQGPQVGHAQVEEQDGAGLGAAARVPHQDQQQQQVTSDPNHQGEHADHGQHHGEGDGGVCGDGVEQEVDDGWHGASDLWEV